MTWVAYQLNKRRTKFLIFVCGRGSGVVLFIEMGITVFFLFFFLFNDNLQCKCVLHAPTPTF